MKAGTTGGNPSVTRNTIVLTAEMPLIDARRSAGAAPAATATATARASTAATATADAPVVRLPNPQRYGTVARLEWTALLVALSLLGLRHVAAINWVRFIAAFVVIDLVGYIPGAIAYHRAGGHAKSPTLPRLYHHLYNVMHTFLTWGAVVAVWAWVAGGLEWAMLAIPIHLAGDRGLFGNGLKPRGTSFEPYLKKEAP